MVWCISLEVCMAYPFVSGGLNDIIGLSLTSDEDTGGR